MNLKSTLILGMLLMVSSPARAQQPDVKEMGPLLGKTFAELAGWVLKSAEMVPADKYTYKATPQQRDFGQQVLHIAQANINNLRFLGGKAPAPMLNRNATSKAEAIAAMDASFDYGTALINEYNDQTLMETVQTNQFLGPSSRARVIWLSLIHI